MELSENIYKVIEAMAQDMAEIMKIVLVAKDNWYEQSNLVKSFQTAVKENGNNYIMELTANSYIYWLDKGRGPSNMPPTTRWSDPVGDISDWCQRRGIPNDNNTVWAIITKMHKEGYEGKHFIDDFWDEMDSKMDLNFDSLFDTICEYLSKEVFND